MEEEKQPKKKRSSSQKAEENGQNYSSRKPWWLVIVLVLALASFGSYIWWLNSPKAQEYPSIWAYLSGLENTEVIPESTLGMAADSLMTTSMVGDTTLGQNLTADAWSTETSSPGGTAPAPSGSETTAPFSDTAGETVYYIKAGEFKTKGSALARIRELRQGNYTAKLEETQTPDGQYRVIVGEFKNLNSARAKSREINFILEINTSVEKKE